MQRWRHLVLAVLICLALVPSAAEGTMADTTGVASAAGVSATQVIIRPASRASMSGLEARLARDGARILERSMDGEAVLVEVPAGRGSRQYARDIAAAIPVTVAEPLGYVHASEVPTDPSYSVQWGLPAIAAPAAWDHTWGDASVIIAVVDSGVDLDQPDLVDQIVVDGGWDFVGNDAVPDDVAGHGTHVAGIAAAEANNGVLGSGTAPGCRILPVRVLDSSGNGSDWDLAQGIYWAADHGAGVINMSLGSEYASTYVSEAVAYAIAQDVVVVAAAGNEYEEVPRPADVAYPAREPGVIAVGAVSSSLVVAAFSQRGPNLDVVAPGVNIFSTVIGTTGQYWNGTSMAAPFVAGTAALMRSANPDATQADIAAALNATATDLGAAGRDDTYGYGLIQADAAVALATVAPVTALTTNVTAASTGWYLTAPTITLAPYEPATTYYSWDTAEPKSYSVYAGPLTTVEGEQTLSYYSVDGDGITESVKTRTFKVDSVKPLAPTGLTATADNSWAWGIGLSWTAVTGDVDGGTDTSGVARYRIYKDGVYLAETASLTYYVNYLLPETTYTFRVVAKDTAGNESAASAPASGTTPKMLPYIITELIQNGTVGRPYGDAISATGGMPLTWSITAGSLPDGVTLSPTTGALGGTPTAAGAFAFTVKVTNTAGSDTRAFSMTVEPAPLVPVYRFYNFTNNTHFFTDSASERDAVIAQWSNVYNYEGVAYYTNPLNNTQPLYRFYNRASGSHFYTASIDEANSILLKWSNVFSLDGQTYAVNPVEVPNSIPVYRFYNVTNGSHFYTASLDEANMVIVTWPTVYRYEGTAFWLGQ